MKLLLIDNFDSFVYNIYQYIGELGHRVDVVRNNQVTLEQIKANRYDAIILSPGPGTPSNPKDFGICTAVILELGKTLPLVPLLGVCLGHQGIVHAFGGKILRAKKPMHGKRSAIVHDGKGIFAGVQNPLQVMRYHSLIVEEASLPDCLKITAKSEDDGAIMAVQHKTLPLFGVQFHPESILAEDGKKILQNFCMLGDRK